VDLQFKTSRNEVQHAGLVLANACLDFTAVCADLLSFWDVVLDSDLRQSVVIGLA
jgi:hypothetical protein